MRYRIVRRLRKAFAHWAWFFWHMRWRARIVALLMLSAVVSVVAIEVTGQPGFCNSCHIMIPYYASWKTSTHAEVNCLDCHLKPGFTGYVKGKINGLAQVVDDVVGRVGTKPSATIQEISCLRSECHTKAELLDGPVDYNSVTFSHTNHIDNVVDGVKLSCGSCHSHFEGNQHFSVNQNACYACHFLANADGTRPVATGCTGCHEVPSEVIRRGFVKIDHQEFVSYAASCEDSCHKREVEQAGQVEETVCLNCHDFRNEADANSVELHEAHTTAEKVECFACHGKIAHGQTQVQTVSDMMDCQSCHSNTHQVQRTIYSTDPNATPTPAPHAEDRVLSPMFLTHVECTGCHVEQTAKTPGTLDSFGTVARAVPSACDRCHEPGTGDQYVPFWQSTIKALYEKVDRKATQFAELAQLQGDPQRAQEMGRRAQQARSILDSIQFDGSWGVHNFKYTEALLLEVDKLVTSGN
ncbi:MAG: NapC/NirT family cytochrome c [Sedimentisphaerales bacterium]|nr:NapC/NirT family cytochrome c [Sedimentisphaerales bacterium]